MICLRRTLFPEPERPIIVVTCPSYICKFTFSRTVCDPKRLVIFLNSIRGIFIIFSILKAVKSPHNPKQESTRRRSLRQKLSQAPQPWHHGYPCVCAQNIPDNSRRWQQ